jgi:hypothetical protein
VQSQQATAQHKELAECALQKARLSRRVAARYRCALAEPEQFAHRLLLQLQAQVFRADPRVSNVKGPEELLV